MGTQSDERLMSDIEVLVSQSLNYSEMIYEYCNLALQRSLTQQQADRLEAILKQANSDSWLEFLLDEADHIVAHQLGLIKDSFINHQQHKLKKALDRLWCEQILQQIQQRNRSEDIQRYLQAEGLYNGEIDGYLGPRTQNAIELFKQRCYHNSEQSDPQETPTRSAF